MDYFKLACDLLNMRDISPSQLEADIYEPRPCDYCGSTSCDESCPEYWHAVEQDADDARSADQPIPRRWEV